MSFFSFFESDGLDMNERYIYSLESKMNESHQILYGSMGGTTEALAPAGMSSCHMSVLYIRLDHRWMRLASKLNT